MKTEEEKGKIIKFKDYNKSKLPYELAKLFDNYDGTERNVVLLSAIGAISSCLPNYYGKYDGNNYSPNLYVIVVAPPASGKGYVNKSRILIQKIHDNIYEESKILQNLTYVDNASVNKFKLKLKIIPGNISSAQFYEFISNISDGVIMIESEMDTLSQMFKNDWGNISDVLRKAFHHEELSIARKSDSTYIQIREPRLSLVLSGTPDQVKPLLSSQANGLSSRCLIYYYNTIDPFKDVFSTKLNNENQLFEDFGIKLYDLYFTLKHRENNLIFEFSDKQKKHFLQNFSTKQDDLVKNDDESLIPNLRRYGLSLYRIAMVLSALRYIEDLETLKTLEKIECLDDDYRIAYEIVNFLFQGLIENQQIFNGKIVSTFDNEILSELPVIFKRSEIVTIAEKMNIPIRTLDDKLKKWQKNKIVEKIKYGEYKKLI